MPRKKLTTKQAFTMVKQMNNITRRLLNDKMDYGAESNIKMSVQAIVDQAKRIQFNKMLRGK